MACYKDLPYAALNDEKANKKGKVRTQCAAVVHFMQNKGWEKVMAT